MEEGPQRMTGAERSLVTVGRSFTVAKGLVPLWGERSERGLQLAVGPGKAAGHPCLLSPSSPALTPTLSPSTEFSPCWPSPAPDSPREELWWLLLPGHEFLQGMEERPSMEEKGQASPCPSPSPSRRQRPRSARLWACSPGVLRPRILWVSDLRSLWARGPSPGPTTAPGQDRSGLMGGAPCVATSPALTQEPSLTSLGGREDRPFPVLTGHLGFHP